MTYVTRNTLVGELGLQSKRASAALAAEMVTAIVPLLPDTRYTHTQVVAAATWTITHNLGTKPAIVFELDSDPNGMVLTDITYPNLNTAVVEWPTAESGKAYI